MSESALSDCRSTWAITCYFNPFKSSLRLANYRVFQRNLQVPLVAVELSFGNGFDLGEGDADRLVQLQGADVLWQKERLLNLALNELPEECTTVVWIDADVVFASDDWPQRLVQTLGHHPVVQLYSAAIMLPPGYEPDNHSIPDNATVRVALVSALGSRRRIGEWATRSKLDPARHRYAVGFAWAARRGLVERHGFFDASIIGGGDAALVCAAYGQLDKLVERHRLNEQQRRRFLDWARPFHEDVAGRVGHLEGDIFHLWHGDIEKRHYSKRHEDLARLQFDPFADIALARNGTWRWSSDKPALHRLLFEYLCGRHHVEEQRPELNAELSSSNQIESLTRVHGPR